MNGSWLLASSVCKEAVEDWAHDILKRSLFTLVWSADWSISGQSQGISSRQSAVHPLSRLFSRIEVSRRVSPTDPPYGPCGSSFQEQRDVVKERVVLGEKLIFGFKRSDYFTERVQRLIASPEYRQRPKDTEQPEAFPGSGIATNIIEYLAESNLCPSCYVVPGFGVRSAPIGKPHAEDP